MNSTGCPIKSGMTVSPRSHSREPDQVGHDDFTPRSHSREPDQVGHDEFTPLSHSCEPDRVGRDEFTPRGHSRECGNPVYWAEPNI